MISAFVGLLRHPTGTICWICYKIKPFKSIIFRLKDCRQRFRVQQRHRWRRCRCLLQNHWRHRENCRRVRNIGSTQTTSHSKEIIPMMSRWINCWKGCGWDGGFLTDDSRAVWPDLPIFWTLGNFLKTLATINFWSHCSRVVSWLSWKAIDWSADSTLIQCDQWPIL